MCAVDATEMTFNYVEYILYYLLYEKANLFGNYGKIEMNKTKEKTQTNVACCW